VLFWGEGSVGLSSTAALPEGCTADAVLHTAVAYVRCALCAGRGEYSRVVLICCLLTLVRASKGRLFVWCKQHVLRFVLPL
jgi:hypothetical protein